MTRIFCIGRNYAAHIEELDNERPTSPVVFMKPASALAPSGQALRFPKHGEMLHHETEVVLEIGKAGRVPHESEARDFISGLALGLDLTLRDVQSALKAKGLPWEKAKAFDQSAPLGPITPLSGDHDLAHLTFTCHVNGALRQTGNTALMLFSIPRILVELSQIWALAPGDLIYTGTPKGVGPLVPGDTIALSGPQLADASWTVE